MLSATAAQASAQVLLVEGDAAGALVELRAALTTFREVPLPYDLARASVVAARARRALGDVEIADLELERAAQTFGDLGASLDLHGLEGLARQEGPPGGLTSRECDVLRLVAQGSTNREIGDALSISTHTVARHLQNVFTKLGLPSRAAATAYAYEHGIIDAGPGPF